MFDKIEDVRIDEEATGHKVLGSATIAPNKAVRAALASGLTTKAASSSAGEMDLWGGVSFLEKQPKPKAPNPKKEKTPEELEKKQFDTDLAKILGFNTWQFFLLNFNFTTAHVLPASYAQSDPFVKPCLDSGYSLWG